MGGTLSSNRRRSFFFLFRRDPIVEMIFFKKKLIQHNLDELCFPRGLGRCSASVVMDSGGTRTTISGG